MAATDLRRRMRLAPTPRERERWHAMSSTAEALGRDPHTIGRWPASGMNRVHPHMRGDSLLPGLVPLVCLGSPPHAGDSQSRACGGPCTRVEPRTCGVRSGLGFSIPGRCEGRPEADWGFGPFSGPWRVFRVAGQGAGSLAAFR